jgi:hypothetical protein
VAIINDEGGRQAGQQCYLATNYCMRKLFILFFIGFFSLTTSAQRPCNDSVHRQFDFWIGEWEAYGTNGQKAGESKIELILDSCIILENWTSATVTKGLRYAGKSYNTYNAMKKKWQQYWVDNTGGVTEYFNGHYENGKMILETDNTKQFDGAVKILKMTFYNLAADKVRQHGESSTDAGKTWKTDFDLEYRRKK